MSTIEHNRMAVVVGAASMQDGPEGGLKVHRAAGVCHYQKDNALSGRQGWNVVSDGGLQVHRPAGIVRKTSLECCD